MRQWFLRTTAYADRLLAGLDELDWPERAKRLQRQWIGRSEGREIDFGDLTVFTTRPETLPGVTFLAVPEDHPAVGSTRPHPLSGAAVPVVGADYVIGSYGTGAVMGVPAHDRRDRRLAEARGLAVLDADPLTTAGVELIGRPAVRFRMHDWLISRQRYWGPPIPIVHCRACGAVPVPDAELPVVLPDIEDFRPTGTGRSPLASVEEFVKTHCPSCAGPAERETDVSDTFVDSAWYFLRYPSVGVDDQPWDPARTAALLPVDFYAGGQEHVQRHHLYARFMTMALCDLGLVPFEEPFPKVRLGGMIVKDGAKMSKSRGNVISPDDYVGRVGADVLRAALLFTSPWEADGDFRDQSIPGVERFFSRLWVTFSRPSEDDSVDAADVDRTIVAVTEAFERLRFNVALARLMELAPAIRSDRAKRVACQLLAPLAPHLAEELWARLGQPFSVHASAWPAAPAGPAGPPESDVVVQLDGRVRGRLRLPPDVPEATALAQACELLGIGPPPPRGLCPRSSYQSRHLEPSRGHGGMTSSE